MKRGHSFFRFGRRILAIVCESVKSVLPQDSTHGKTVTKEPADYAGMPYLQRFATYVDGDASHPPSGSLNAEAAEHADSEVEGVVSCDGMEGIHEASGSCRRVRHCPSQLFDAASLLCLPSLPRRTLLGNSCS